MDIGNATLLAFTLYILVDLTKKALPVVAKNVQLLVLVVVVWSLAVPQLVANSDWGVKQVIDGIPLNTMNTASLVLVSIALAGYAGVIYKLIEQALPNIGQNQPSDE